jgi:hypothetical protein
MSGRNAKSAFLPLVLLWLAAHAVLLAALLGVKFLLTKSAVVVLLLVTGAMFLFTRIRKMPSRLSHSPMA